VLDRVLRNHESCGHTVATQRGYSDIVNLFARYLAAHGHPTTIGAITAEHVEGWAADVRARGRSARTIRRYVSAVKAFSRRTVELNYVEADPLAEVWTPRAPVLAKPSLSAEEIERIVASCDRRSVTGRRDLALVLLLGGGCAPRRPSGSSARTSTCGAAEPTLGLTRFRGSPVKLVLRRKIVSKVGPANKKPSNGSRPTPACGCFRGHRPHFRP